MDGSTGQLRLAEALDREAKDSYVLRVRADDGLQHTDCTLNLLVSTINFYHIYIYIHYMYVVLLPFVLYNTFDFCEMRC